MKSCVSIPQGVHGLGDSLISSRIRLQSARGDWEKSHVRQTGRGEETMGLNSGRAGPCRRACPPSQGTGAWTAVWRTTSGILAEGRKAVVGANVSQVTTPCIYFLQRLFLEALLRAKLCSTPGLTFYWGKAVKKQ